MKILLATIFIHICMSTSAQITGIVLSENKDPVEFATVLNFSKQTSSITNADGLFHLEGAVGDSIRIQHLNYNMREFEVVDLDFTYSLFSKTFNLNEIIVSANYAAKLFEKACKNTYERLKDKNISKGYLRNVTIENNDTVQLIDLDLDIVQRKQREYNLKDKISPYKVQERIEYDTSCVSDLRIKLSIFPSFNGVDWKKFQDYFNCYKLEDSEYFKLYFFNKKSFRDSITHIEVKIHKSDSCLFSFSMVTRQPFRNKKDEILNMKTISFLNVKYDYSTGGSIIDEVNEGSIFTESENGRKNVSIFQFFKIYDKQKESMNRRPKGHLIFDNTLESKLIKNKYDNEFWESDSYLEMIPFDYKFLLNLSFDRN